MNSSLNLSRNRSASLRGAVRTLLCGVAVCLSAVPAWAQGIVTSSGGGKNFYVEGAVVVVLAGLALFAICRPGPRR